MVRLDHRRQLALVVLERRRVGRARPSGRSAACDRYKRSKALVARPPQTSTTPRARSAWRTPSSYQTLGLSIGEVGETRSATSSSWNMSVADVPGALLLVGAEGLQPALERGPDVLAEHPIEVDDLAVGPGLSSRRHDYERVRSDRHGSIIHESGRQL